MESIGINTSTWNALKCTIWFELIINIFIKIKFQKKKKKKKKKNIFKKKKKKKKKKKTILKNNFLNSF